MSSRSRQAQRSARNLTLLADVLVQAIHQRGQLIQWGNGPRMNTMSEQVAEQPTTGNCPDLSAQTLSYARGYSVGAFAARPVAAHRDGSLIAAIQAGVRERDRLGITAPLWSDLGAEELAAHQHIESLLEETAHPDRPDTPADEPAIAALIRYRDGNEYAILPMLVSPRPLQPDPHAVQREAQALL